MKKTNIQKSWYLGIGAFAASAVSVIAAKDRVNFVQILADDLGYGDLQCYGHPHIQTPNIDKMAGEGIKFTQCYSGGATCSPSRAALLTGRTPYRNGVNSWIPRKSHKHLRATEPLLPLILRDAGYDTAHIGKWHLSTYGEQKVGRESSYTNFSFGAAGQPSMDDYGYNYYFLTGNVARPSHHNPENFFRNGKAVGPLEGYAAQIVAKDFDNWLNNVRDKSKPFFVTIWFHETHGPIDSAPRFVELYDDASKYMGVKQYYANSSQLDDGVGKVIESLKSAGLFENTFTFFTSDNGPEGSGNSPQKTRKVSTPWDFSRYNGTADPFRGRKRDTEEGGIRVPGVVTWPAGASGYISKYGHVCSTPISGNDYLPTVLAIAGLELPDATLDGSSFHSLLKGEGMHRTKHLYWRNNKGEFRLAMIDGDWKIMGDAARQKFRLYNLKDDIKESNDISHENPERFKEMKSRLIKYDDDVLAEDPASWNKSSKREFPGMKKMKKK